MEVSGSTIIDQATAVVLGGACDRSSVQLILGLLKSSFGRVIVIIASSMNSEVDFSSNDRIYFMKIGENPSKFDLHEVMRRAVELAPNSVRFLIFEDVKEVQISERTLKTIVKKQLDFQKLALGTIFISKRYLLHILETGQMPTAVNAVRDGYSSEMSITQMLSSPKLAIRQYSTLASFALVGASGVGVNLLVLTLFKPIIGALVANALAQEVSIASNFVWNDRFTFRTRAGAGRYLTLSRLKRFTKYNLVSLLSFAVNETVFYLVYSHGVFYIYSSLIAIATAFVVNYFGSSRWAWAKTVLQLAKD